MNPNPDSERSEKLKNNKNKQQRLCSQLLCCLPAQGQHVLAQYITAEHV